MRPFLSDFDPQGILLFLGEIETFVRSLSDCVSSEERLASAYRTWILCNQCALLDQTDLALVEAVFLAEQLNVLHQSIVWNVAKRVRDSARQVS